MNKTLTVLVPLCFLLAACPSTPPSASVIPNCPAGPAADVCPQGPDGHPDPDKRNKITIHVTPSIVQVAPPIVCAHPGTSITATVTKAASVPADFVVATVPKDGSDGWIISSRTGVGTMSIDVPGTTGVDTDHGYFVMTSTGKCLDPMIHVD